MGEKELLQSVVATSRAEAEAELQKEEELLRITIAQSLAKKAKEEKDEQEKEELLIQEAVTQSLAEDITNKEKIKRDEEEQLQQALAFIRAEEVKLSKDELLENPLSQGEHPEFDWELEKVLKLSEEKEHVCENQEGQLKQPASRDLLGSEVKISKDKVVCDNVQKSLSKGEEFGSELEMYKLSLEENEHTGKEEQQLKKPPENIKLCLESSDDSEAKKSLESIALDSENSDEYCLEVTRAR